MAILVRRIKTSIHNLDSLGGVSLMSKSFNIIFSLSQKKEKKEEKKSKKTEGGGGL